MTAVEEPFSFNLYQDFLIQSTNQTSCCSVFAAEAKSCLGQALGPSSEANLRSGEQVAFEPIACQIRDLFQRSWFFKKVCRSRHDNKLLLAAELG